MSSDDLAHLQNQFQAYLLGENKHVLKSVVENDICCKEVRLQVYQDAYFARLQEALGHDYPVLAKLMGEEQFEQCTQAYIFNYPSVYRSIRWFGGEFANFLKTNQNPAALFWSELAKFEWALANTFDVEDATPITESALQQVAPEKWAEMTFEFHPSFMLVDLDWNAPTIWKAAYRNRKVKPIKYKKSHTYLMWRHELETYFLKLTVTEAWALNAALQRMPFAKLCEGLSVWVSQEQLILYAAGLLKSWIHKGLITRLEII